MGTRIAECHDITGESASKDCVETREAAPSVEPCTVATDVCSLTTGDAEVKKKETTKEKAVEAAEDCCCCEC